MVVYDPYFAYRRFLVLDFVLLSQREMLQAIKTQLLRIVDDIDAGNSNIDEEEALQTALAWTWRAKRPHISLAILRSPWLKPSAKWAVSTASDVRTQSAIRSFVKSQATLLRIQSYLAYHKRFF